MKKAKKQLEKQAMEDFLEKIKSIGISTGAKQTGNCSICGEPMSDHPVAVAPIAVIASLIPLMSRSAKSELNSGNEETAFAS